MDENNQFEQRESQIETPPKIENKQSQSRSSKLATVLCVLIIIGLAAALAFSYYEMSGLRRDLYAVRKDYYAVVDDPKAAEDPDTYTADFELISQKVQDIRIVDTVATSAKPYVEGEPYQEVFKSTKVRVLEVKITNDTESIYNYTDSIGAEVAGGKIVRGVAVHPDDNQNEYVKNGGYTLDLAPGGEATVYVYLLDTGTDVKKLYDVNSSMEIGI